MKRSQRRVAVRFSGSADDAPDVRSWDDRVNASVDAKLDQTGDLSLAPSPHLSEVLRRPIESTQYLPITYTERLAEAGIAPSVGSCGDSYDNALAESVIGLVEEHPNLRAGVLDGAPAGGTLRADVTRSDPWPSWGGLR